MTTPGPAQHPLDVFGAIATGVLSDIGAAGQFLANDFSATVNRLAGRCVTTPDEALAFWRTPLEYDDGPDIEIPAEAMHSFDEVFGDDHDDHAGGQQE